MRIESKAFIRQNVHEIQSAVRKAERKFLPSYIRTAKREGNFVIPLDGPRYPEYQGTTISFALEYLDKLALPPEHHFADLGAGLGSACYAAAACFDRVTGIEGSRRCTIPRILLISLRSPAGSATPKDGMFRGPPSTLLSENNLLPANTYVSILTLL